MREGMEHDYDSAPKIKNLMKSIECLANSGKESWIRAICFDYLEVKDVTTTKN